MQQSRRRFLAGMAASLGLGYGMAALPAWASHAGNANAVAAPLGTAAAVDGKGRLWVATLEADAANAKAFNIVLQWSTDEGRSWSPARRVLRTPEAIEASGESRPKLAFGRQGQIYVSYTKPLGKPYTGDIRFVRSTDGGESFSEPVTVQRDRALISHRFDSLIVDREGRVFIAWIDKRDGEAARAAQRPFRGASLYYAVSTDDGASFGPDRQIVEHTCECCRIALALDAQGRVVAMWRHVFEPNIRDHAWTVLPAEGMPAAPRRASFDDWHIDACPHHGGALAYDAQGRRHQVWFHAAGEEGGLFHAVADASGTLGKPLRLGGVQAGHGEVAVSGRQVVTVWKEFDGDATRVLAMLSADGGASWKTLTLASTRAASDHPHLVQSGSATWLVWRTQDEGVVVRAIREGA